MKNLTVVLKSSEFFRDHLLLSFTKLYQPKVGTSVKLATKVCCSSTFETDSHF